jgi:hypothetical protein
VRREAQGRVEGTKGRKSRSNEESRTGLGWVGDEAVCTVGTERGQQLQRKHTLCQQEKMSPAQDPQAHKSKLRMLFRHPHMRPMPLPSHSISAQCLGSADHRPHAYSHHANMHHVTREWHE